MKITKKQIVQMVMTAFLIALKVVLERFLSYSVWNSRIGFSFIAVAFAAAMYGPVTAMLVGGIGDIAGALLLPSGPYFFGFTLTAVLTAFCTASFIYKNATVVKIAVSVLINQIFGSVLLNSLWISIVFGVKYWASIPTRLIQSVIMTVIQIVLITILFGEKSPVRQALKKQIKL